MVCHLVNWFSVEIHNHSGKRTYYNSFITDLPVTADNVAELAACGRARCRGLVWQRHTPS